MENKISLCCITGNAEKYISRFLSCFKRVADEIVIVRAIGNQEPDNTLAIASDAGCVVGEYRDSQSWPHVDDFAAARQTAFDMATHPFVMWADMDDTITPESCAAIRQAVDALPPECDGLEVAYDVPEDGIIGCNFRERVIRRGIARWKSPIHEFLDFGKVPHLARVSHADARIVHAPSGNRKPNDERNLRILESIPDAERTSSHKFHLFQSLRAVGRMQDAAAMVFDLLRNSPKDIGTPEKYELFIAAGQLATEPEHRAQMMLQALGVDPSRREAYGELALAMIALNRPEDALAYTTAMRSIPRPEGAAWNQRTKYYGYAGEQIHGMALRACGFFDEADAIEANHFILNGRKISLLHATRGRVHQAVQARREWLAMAANPDAVEHIFGLDADDPQAIFLTVHNHAMTDGKSGSVAAWNACAAKSNGDILVQLSDDWKPFYAWDTAILREIQNPFKPVVLAINDGHRRDDLLCMAILTRSRYEQQGYLFHPDFFSVYSDNWFSHCAFRDGVVIDARDRITFEHLHPAFGKAEMDQTYMRGNSQQAYELGAATFEKLVERESAQQ